MDLMNGLMLTKWSYHADDVLASGAFGKFAGVQDVACFADAVLYPSALVFLVIPGSHVLAFGQIEIVSIELREQAAGR